MNWHANQQASMHNLFVHFQTGGAKMRQDHDPGVTMLLTKYCKQLSSITFTTH